MKRILNSLLLASFLLSTSCVDEFKVGDAFWDKAPSVDKDKEYVFSNPDYTRDFLWNAYRTLYYGRVLDWSAKGNRVGMGAIDALTDCFTCGLTWCTVYNTYYTGQFTSNSAANDCVYSYSDGEQQWTGIRKAWLFIENVGQTPGITDEEKERLKAEAKMIIACHYSDMFKNFGGVPLLDHALDPNEELKIPRATLRQTLDFIVQLCDEAYKVLPWALDSSEQENWAGRFTGAAALGLKIRTLLFAASPLYNDNQPFYPEQAGAAAIAEKQVWFGGKDDQLWRDVVDACSLFMSRNSQEGEPWQLVTNASNPRQAYQDAYYKRANGELLIDTRQRATVSWNWDDNCSYLHFYGQYGALVPTLEYVNLFPYADGTPFDASFWEQQRKDKYIEEDPFKNRDPRLYENCLVNNAEFGRDHPAELWIGGREGMSSETVSDGSKFTGFRIYKYILDLSSQNGKQDQWPYLRLPEIFLSYAEALNELDRATERDALGNDAYEYINKVRRRVGLSGLQTGLSKEQLRKEILDERAREFGAEDVRYYDMIRWKMAEDFRKPLHGLRIRRGDDKKSYSYEKFQIKKRYIQDGDDGTVYFTPKWYLTPFPFVEINKGYLNQNPGW